MNLHEYKRNALLLSLAMLGLCGVSAAHAQQGHGHCRLITAACLNAGFALGKGKEGTGLWLDCINPIMQAAAQRRMASKALPQVDPQIVAACKATNETALFVAHQLSAGRFAVEVDDQKRNLQVTHTSPRRYLRRTALSTSAAITGLDDQTGI